MPGRATPGREKNIKDEFVTALLDEVSYARKSKGKACYLTHGSLQRFTSEYFVYHFHSHRPLMIADEMPGKLEIDGLFYDCSVVSSQGLEIELAVTKALGERITSAILTSSQGDLLNRLVEKLEKVDIDRGETFSLAKDVFIGRSRALPGTDEAGSYPRYNYSPEQPPNDSQKLAVLNSFTNSLAIIWGPPGTGKTSTIAHCVQAHLNAGRRVLLVSHANAAVDAALKEIAGQVRDTYYEEGKLLRLGVPSDAFLEQHFPMLIADHQVARATALQAGELLMLQEAFVPLQARIENCNRLLVVVDKVKQLERAMQKPEESPTGKLKQRQAQLQAEIGKAEIQLASAERYLKSIVGQAVYTYENVVKDLQVFINVRKNMINDMQKQIDAHAGGQSPEEELDSAYEELDRMMSATGLDPNEAAKSKKETQIILAELEGKLVPIKQKISVAQTKIVGNARLIATTLSKVFCAAALEKERFDIVVVDEASMVPMPSLFWALGKATMGATFVGDFKQLPPICLAKTDMAAKWLRRSIFDELRISSVDSARKNARVSILDTQYHMTGKLTDVANQLFYGGLLKKGSELDGLQISDSISEGNALTIVDTSAVAHHCIQPPEGSRVNIYSAGLCATLCRKLLAEHPTATIGIATPYRAQADLIDEILVDTDLQGRVKVSTVHKFQGGQATIIIFDCVDGLGSGHSSLDDRLKDSSAEVLLNVALTRAKAKFFLVVNKTHFFNTLSADSLMLKFIAALGANGTKVDARSIDDNFAARNIESDTPQKAVRDSSVPGSLFNEKNFWDAFFADLDSAGQSLTIVSPMITIKRTRTLVPKLETLISRGLRLTLFTKPATEHSQSYVVDDANQAISLLEKMGVRVIQQKDVNQKVAIIDDHICWEGSLNLFSHTGSTLEHMRRLAGSATAAEIKGNLRL